MDMRKATKWFTIDSTVTAVIFIALGALFILLPNSFSNLLCIISGVLFIIGGIASFIIYLANRTAFSPYVLALSIVLLILGIFGVTHIVLIKGVLSYFFGIFIVIAGAIYLSKTIDNMRNRMGNCVPQFIMSLIVLALGIIILFTHFSTVMIFTGIVLIAVGIFSIIMSAIFAHQARKFYGNQPQNGPMQGGPAPGPMPGNGPMGPGAPIESEWHEMPPQQ